MQRCRPTTSFRSAVLYPAYRIREPDTPDSTSVATEQVGVRGNQLLSRECKFIFRHANAGRYSFRMHAMHELPARSVYPIGSSLTTQLDMPSKRGTEEPYRQPGTSPPQPLTPPKAPHHEAQNRLILTEGAMELSLA